MIHVTRDTLESLAFDYGATITMSHGRATLTLGSVTYAAPLPPPPVRAEVGGEDAEG